MGFGYIVLEKYIFHRLFWKLEYSQNWKGKTVLLCMVL